MIIKWGLQPFNPQLNSGFWCVFLGLYTDTVMADKTCSCFWPNSQNHASQHTDGNTTVSKTHSRLFEKHYICFTMSRMKKHVGNLWLFFPSLFVLALESKSESQLHRPHHSTSYKMYSTFLLFVLV